MNHKAYKIRIYPNNKQKMLLNKTFGCVRFLYNQFLDERINVYKELKDDKKKLHDHKYLTEKDYKEKHNWLKEVDSIPLQQSRIDLNTAYKMFFRKINKFPNFKSKHAKQSYRTINTNNNIKINYSTRQIKVPKISWIKFRDSRIIENKINSVTLSRSKTNKYYASILVEEEIVKLDKVNKNVGIDLGLKHFVIASDGIKIENPRFLRKRETKLTREQRRLSRKKKGSNNKERQKLNVAKVHEKIANRRNDFLHKLSTKLIRENQIIGLEDLNVKGMLKNHKLAKSISDVSWSRFVSMLKYKAEWYGREIRQIDRFFPSSKICHHCGCINDDLKLSDRIWTCPDCNAELDRDINAAINILINTVGTTEIKACGDKSSGLDNNHYSSETIVDETRRYNSLELC